MSQSDLSSDLAAIRARRAYCSAFCHTCCYDLPRLLARLEEMQKQIQEASASLSYLCGYIEAEDPVLSARVQELVNNLAVASRPLDAP